MNELEQWKLDVYKYFANKYFMSNPDNWEELAQKAAEEYILKNVPKLSTEYSAGTLPELVVTPKSNATTTYSSEISNTDPEYLKYKLELLYKSYLLGSQVSSAMNEAGKTIGGIAMTAVDFSPLWWATMTGRTGAELYNGNYRDAIAEVGLGLLAPYAVGKGLKYLGKGALKVYEVGKDINVYQNTNPIRNIVKNVLVGVNTQARKLISDAVELTRLFSVKHNFKPLTQLKLAILKGKADNNLYNYIDNTLGKNIYKHMPDVSSSEYRPYGSHNKSALYVNDLGKNEPVTSNWRPGVSEEAYDVITTNKGAKGYDLEKTDYTFLILLHI